MAEEENIVAAAAQPRLKTLREIAELTRSFTVPVRVAGRVERFEARLLTAAESERLEVMAGEVLPEKKVGADGRDYYDMADPKHVERVVRVRRRMRALALVWCVRVIGEAAAADGVKLGDVERVYDWVQGQLPESVLQGLFDVISTDGTTLEETVNF